MFQRAPQNATPQPAQAADARAAGDVALERSWHLSSFDLAHGLMVVEADDEDVRSLFDELPPQ